MESFKYLSEMPMQFLKIIPSLVTFSILYYLFNKYLLSGYYVLYTIVHWLTVPPQISCSPVSCECDLISYRSLFSMKFLIHCRCSKHEGSVSSVLDNEGQLKVIESSGCNRNSTGSNIRSTDD